MPGKTRTVSSHTRNGKPVSGYKASYTPRQTWSQKMGAIAAGHQKGNVKLAILGGIGLGVGSGLFMLLHIVMTGTEIAVLFGAISMAVLGIRIGRKRRHPFKYRKRPVIVSLKERKHFMLAQARRAKPMNVYRSTRTRTRKRFPFFTGVYDGWMAPQQVTVTTGKGKTKKTESFTVRGVHNANTFVAQRKEQHRQSGAKTPFNISNRQVFR